MRTKKIILQCVNNSWLDKNPFVGYKAKVREVERTFHSEEELHTIAVNDCKTERLGQVSCGTSCGSSCGRSCSSCGGCGRGD